MRLVRLDTDSFNLLGMDVGFRNMRLRTKLLVTLIPSVVLILIFTGYVTHWFSTRFLNEAIERNVQVQTLAISHEVEIFLDQCREDLLILAQHPVGLAELLRAADARRSVRGTPYRELAFLSQKAKDNVFLVSAGGSAAAIRTNDISSIRPNPLLLLDRINELKRGEVWVSEIVEAVYPAPAEGQGSEGMASRILRFATPYFTEGSAPKGLLMLAIDVRQLREILSVFNSPRSPIYAYVRSPETRYSYLFDRDGWMLFQSESAEDLKRDLSTEQARSGFIGTFGKPGLESAFKPISRHSEYWKMVGDAFKGRHGLLRVSNPYSLGFAPVQFEPFSGESAVLFGVALVDRSRLPLWAGYRQIDVMFIVTIATIVIISLLIFALSQIITRPTLRMASAVSQIPTGGKLEEITLPEQDYETGLLKNAVNQMIRTLRGQIEEIRQKDDRIEAERQREKVRLEEEISALRRHLHAHDIEEIVGFGPVIDALKSDVFKAASVDADVLIIGETGTGKQLIAEAIHKRSARCDKPFISLNCGALDENLLFDSLFGHIKGAFTEARADRKGAFLAAHEGTLFLDEIGAASTRVQQALLRAISMRKIRPLGSDQEIDVDVRLIAATNVDLKESIEKGLFRQDLYYRLEVLTIRTPSLRDHGESIPILVDYFLKQASRLMNKDGMGLSRGALEKLKAHPWPGNVRELMNCVTRTLAMASGTVIQADDVSLSGEETAGPRKAATILAAPIAFPSSVAPAENGFILSDYNVRQRKALPFILSNGRISRSEYQQTVGDRLPSRTALYDLQDLVARGILRKVGRGPATQYYLAKTPESGK